MVVTDGLAATVAPVVDDKPAEGAQVYVIPPDAVSVVDEPLQMAPPDEALIVGSEFTVTVTVAKLKHPVPLVPVTVYVVVTVGLAVILIPVVADNPTGGDHW